MTAQMKTEFITSSEHGNVTVKWNSDDHADDAGFTLRAHDADSGAKVLVHMDEKSLVELGHSIDCLLAIKKLASKDD